MYRITDKNKKNFINNDEIFQFALEIWLELRKEINLNESEAKGNEQPQNLKYEQNITIESKFEENQVFEIFEKKFREKFSDCFISTKIMKEILK